MSTSVRGTRRGRRSIHRPAPRVIALPGGAELDGSPLSIDRPAIRGYQRVAVGLALSDGMALTLAAALASWIVAPHRALTPVLLLDVAAWLAVFHLFGLYGIQHLSASEEFRRIISATSVGIAVVAIAASWWEPTLTRSWIACAWTLALLFQLAERRVWRKVVYWFRDRGWLAFRTLVVGTNEEAETLVRTMRGDRSLGFLPVGYLTTSERTVESDGVPVVGGIRNIDRAIREGGIECLFVASTAVTADEMYRVSRACRRANVEMRVSANLPEILTSRLTIQHIDRVMALSVRPVRLTRTQAVLKRSFDLAVASVALVVLSPLIVVLAAIIALTSGRPVLFRHQRVTKDGRVFMMVKLRTMVTDQGGALADRVIDLTKPFFKLEDDPRLTRVGRVLRSWSLDELPQLWNVIRGEMSLVGPRPLPIEQVGANLALLAPRHEVRAGITGWWQIQGRSDVRPEDAIEMDLFYIENWSLYLDLYILLKTFGRVFLRDGAM